MRARAFSFTQGDLTPGDIFLILSYFYRPAGFSFNRNSRPVLFEIQAAA